MITRENYTRTGRFLDPTNPFQKIPEHEKGFESTFHYKHVSHLISLQFSKILKMLHNELAMNHLYLTTWTQAKQYSVQRKKNDRLPMECCIAVIAYTMDEKVNGKKLYLDFNEKCRRLENDNAWRNFPYKSLYALLARAIHGIDNNPDVTNQIYYRGLKCRVTDLKADDCVFSSQFLSCTIDKNVAMQFISSTDDNAEGTLMVFEGSPMAACGVMNYSLFKDEQEMLVFPWSTFKVTRIITVSNLDQIFLKTIGPFITNLPYSGAYIKRGLMLDN